MTMYEASKHINVYDRKIYHITTELLGIGTTQYYRYHCIRWLAWYRVFYRHNDKVMCKHQMQNFISDLQFIHK